MDLGLGFLAVLLLLPRRLLKVLLLRRLLEVLLLRRLLALLLRGRRHWILWLWHTPLWGFAAASPPLCLMPHRPERPAYGLERVGSDDGHILLPSRLDVLLVLLKPAPHVLGVALLIDEVERVGMPQFFAHTDGLIVAWGEVQA